MMVEYHYVRFRWWRGVDIKEVAKDFGELFKVELMVWPSSEIELSLYRDERNELKVTADTLTALLSAFRVVLFQKEAAPFTARDMKLRTKVLELYPQSRPTPFPWMFVHEPEFEVAK